MTTTTKFSATKRKTLLFKFKDDTVTTVSHETFSEMAKTLGFKMGNFFSSLKGGDIVQCRFPQDKIRQPGPKERPALVIDVEEYELPDGYKNLT